MTERQYRNPHFKILIFRRLGVGGKGRNMEINRLCRVAE